jgi:exodeoxyribonuclease-1
MSKINATYLFYDIETTGLSKCFDQILQFAAIRTDLEFNELEQHEFQIKLNQDIIPAPEALITHRIPFDELQHGESEIDALMKIHQLMNTPGTISLGYNTLGYDDEFLRFSFYRNLLAPYTHQYANQCGRMDIYPITVLYYLFKPELLHWPIINGKISLKLANLIAENSLTTGKAHNALVDVKATLALAKKLREIPAMWDFSRAYFDKETDLSRLAKLSGEALLIQGKIGAQDNYIAPVLSLGQHYHYKNQTLWLRLDQVALASTTHNTIAENTYVFRKKLGENPLLLPIHDRYLEKISQERQALARDNKKWLHDNPAILKEIQEYHRNFVFPIVPDIDIDAALYQIGFPSREEEALFLTFHQATPENKTKIAEKFPSKKRQALAYRILGRFYTEHMNHEGMVYFQDYQNQETLIDYRSEKKLSAKMAQEKIDELLSSASLDAEQIKILKDYQVYLEALVATSSLK